MQLELPPYAAGLAEQIAESLARVEGMRQMESAGMPDTLIEQFRDLLAAAPGGHTTIVVVDTFEEAQFLGPDVVWPLLDFLARLANAAPMVRIAVSGRVLPPEYAPPGSLPPIDLEELDEASARELLALAIEHAALAPLTGEELDDVVAIVGRNPMSLNFAVRLLRDEGVERFRTTRSRVLVRLKAEKVQALLYGRILHHIHDQDVRRIARPGLILRRITPDVIRHVLAGPCGLELTPERDEYAIFQDLQREAALVETEIDGSLRHRADVAGDCSRTWPTRRSGGASPRRRRRLSPSTRPGPGRSPGQGIYHRLRRREPAAVLDQRWLPEAGSWLSAAMEELPAQQRLWLAGKLGATLDPSVREAASQEAWEAQAKVSADRYLQSRFAEDALGVLHEREERLPPQRAVRARVGGVPVPRAPRRRAPGRARGCRVDDARRRDRRGARAAAENGQHRGGEGWARRGEGAGRGGRRGGVAQRERAAAAAHGGDGAARGDGGRIRMRLPRAWSR